MKRRQRDDSHGPNDVPAELARFTPGHWPGATEWRQYQAWTEALDEWLDRHPEAEGWYEGPESVAWDPAIDPP